MQRDLFDEYRICIALIILGGGTPLFKLHDHSRRLKLVASRTLATGGMILTYHPFPATAAGTPNEPAGA